MLFDSEKHGRVRYWSTDGVGFVGTATSPWTNLTEHVFHETGLFNAFGGVDIVFKGKVSGMAGEEVLVAGDAVFSDFYTFDYNLARQSFFNISCCRVAATKIQLPAI